MILSLRKKSFSVPLSTKCIIHTKGQLNSGDIVEVTSPLFPSINYNVKTLELTETLSIPLRTNLKDVHGDGKLEAYLHCNDNDVFHMYVQV